MIASETDEKVTLEVTEEMVKEFITNFLSALNIRIGNADLGACFM